jgi:ABC-type transport system substrate-binding protein
MVDVISYGLGEVANQHIPQWNPGAAKNVEPLAYDLEEAKRMMIKAGYDYNTIIVEGPRKK